MWGAQTVIRNHNLGSVFQAHCTVSYFPNDLLKYTLILFLDHWEEFAQLSTQRDFVVFYRSSRCKNIFSVGYILKISEISFSLFFWNKSFIAWWVSARPEISLRPQGERLAEILLLLHAQFQLGCKTHTVFQWESLLRCENTVDAYALVPFSARDEKNDIVEITWIFLARLAGSPGWNSPCNQTLREFFFLIFNYNDSSML